MSNPIVIAYHLIWTAYGWWLPNDPRGSMSNTIRNDLISDLGETHFGRKKIQPASQVICKHKHPAEVMIANLQQASRRLLREQNIRGGDHPTWGGLGWKVFSDTPEDIRRTIKYVEYNPIRAKLRMQQWDSVKEYDGWPLHPGHSPRSPYAMRLRGRDGRS